MTAAVVVPERFEIWRVFERMAGVLRRNLGSLALIALILAAAPRAIGALVLLLGAHGGDWNVTSYDNGADAVRLVLRHHGPAFFVLGVIGVVSMLLLQPALLFGIVKDLAGRRATLGEMLAVAVRTALPVLAVGVIAWIAIVAGLCLVVVPGVIVGLVLCVATPARVLEGPGIMRALSRSADLTSGYRWSILGFFVILGFIWILASTVYGALVSSTHLAAGVSWYEHIGREERLAWWNWPTLLILSPLAHAIAALVGAAAVASIYFELRFVKEGVAPATLLADFD
ncbi:MAG TPA: hypothetical protein VG248_13020 [Caulobacteraceae bacterium]|jgi:hypothetical protein|nr:hypothetical protein [Caulobacteraceae bacterium]